MKLKNLKVIFILFDNTYIMKLFLKLLKLRNLLK